MIILYCLKKETITLLQDKRELLYLADVAKCILLFHDELLHLKKKIKENNLTDVVD